MNREQLTIGKTYRLPIDGNVYDVTLITTEGENARVLIQNHSIDMSLRGFTRRKKLYSQAVPVRIVPVSELLPCGDTRPTTRGVADWQG
ncbi:MAG: hypothetical protein ACOY3M_05765 [Patescibacteria group bacterium]